jgi:hypothetical protein
VLIALAVALPVAAACGEDQDPRVKLIRTVSENAVYAWEAAGTDGLYDYLASSVAANCSREQLRQAFAARSTPRAWRAIKDVEFPEENRAKAVVVVAQDWGDELQAWEFVEESPGVWRVSSLPGIEECGG